MVINKERAATCTFGYSLTTENENFIVSIFVSFRELRSVAT